MTENSTARLLFSLFFDLVHVFQTKLSKEHPRLNVSLENAVANYPQGSSIGKRHIPCPKPLPDKQLVQRKELPPSSSPMWLIWPRKTWNILYDEIIYVFGWNELPKGINHNSFNWRSVTRNAIDLPCPGYGVSSRLSRNR